MRKLLVAAIVLLSTLSATPAAGAAEPLLTDPAGDTEFEPAGSVGGAAAIPFSGNSVASHADLISLTAAETEDEIVLTLALADLDGNAFNDEYDVKFTWNRQDYAVRISYYNVGVADARGSSAYLLFIIDANNYYYWASLSTVLDMDANTITATLPKVYVLDGNQQPPGRGDALTDVYVQARAEVGPGFFRGEIAPQVTDTMGKDLPGRIVMQKGDFAQGALRLSTNDKIRVSNGGATTFVYKVDVTNPDDRLQEYDVQAIDIPNGWNVRVQSPLRVAAGETRTLAALASVPFEHKHGGYDSFNVTFQSRSDAGTTGKIRLGVLHTPIPQPAGHHPDIYIHSETFKQNAAFDTINEMFGGNSWSYMNTDAEHADDRATILPNGYRGDGVGWYTYLNPGLKMGLDFDITKVGKLVSTIHPSLDSESTITATLTYYAYENGKQKELVLAESDVVSLSLKRGQPAPFELVMTPTPDADFIPYTKYQNMYLEIQLDGTTLAGLYAKHTAPQLSVTDFKLSLPLLEYHDKLTGVSDATSAIDLVADGVVEKIGRPGSTVAYAFNLTNGGTKAGTFEVSVAGGDADLGALVPNQAFALEPGQSRRVTLAVTIPQTANEEQEFEVLVFAHSTEDPSISAIQRTKTTAGRGTNAVADESDVFLAAAQADRDTPGPGALVVLAALGAAAVVLRARRK